MFPYGYVFFKVKIIIKSINLYYHGTFFPAGYALVYPILYKIVDDATKFFNTRSIIPEKQKITPDTDKLSGVIQ